MSIESQVKEIIAEHLGVGLEALASSASFVDDLGADSLDLSEIVITFEHTFKLRISSENAAKLRTVADAVDYIQVHAPASSKRAPDHAGANSPG
jgi:acyl carrier protein